MDFFNRKTWTRPIYINTRCKYLSSWSLSTKNHENLSNRFFSRRFHRRIYRQAGRQIDRRTNEQLHAYNTVWKYLVRGHLQKSLIYEIWCGSMYFFRIRNCRIIKPNRFTYFETCESFVFKGLSLRNFCFFLSDTNSCGILVSILLDRHFLQVP